MVGVSPSCVRPLSFRNHMKALHKQNVMFEVLWSKALRISNPKGMKKSIFFPTTCKMCEARLWLPLIRVRESFKFC